MRTSEPLTSTALGALVLVVAAEHRALRRAAQVLERRKHRVRGLLLERRIAAADGVEQEEFRLIDRRCPGCPAPGREHPLGELARLRRGRATLEPLPWSSPLVFGEQRAGAAA